MQYVYKNIASFQNEKMHIQNGTNMTKNIEGYKKNPNIYFLPYIYFKTKNIWQTKRDEIQHGLPLYMCIHLPGITCSFRFGNKLKRQYCTLYTDILFPFQFKV